MATNSLNLTMNLTKSALKLNLDTLGNKFDVLLRVYMTTKAPQIESYMKQNRKWVDRSSMAKTTLNAKFSKPSKDVYRITLAHGMDYGIWLELANEKKYAIIEPTINVSGPQMMKELQGLLNKLKI